MKKTKMLLLLSLLSVVFLFAACSKESNDSNTDKNEIKTNNESNISIDDNSDNKKNISTDIEENVTNEDVHNQGNTAKKDADIIYTVTTYARNFGNDNIRIMYTTHHDEQNRLVKKIEYSGVAISLITEYEYTTDYTELVETQYNNDGSIKTTETKTLERTNYDNGYYEVDKILYNSKNLKVADISVGHTLYLYQYDEEGTMIESSTYNVDTAYPSTFEFPLSELVTKDFSEWQQGEDYVLIFKSKQEFEFDDNGLVKGYTQTVIRENETMAVQFEFKHTLDDYGNPIKTETWTSYPQHMETITYEYTYAE